MNKFLLRRIGVAHDPSGFKPTLQDCIEAVLAQSDALVGDVLAGLQTPVTPIRGKGQAAALHVPTQSALEALKSREEVFKKAFAVSLRNVVYGGDAQPHVSRAEVKFDDFQFLEEDQIDANIEFALTEQEILLAVDDQLPALHAMVSSLMGWLTVQGHLNPLKPESFVYALRESMKAALPDETLRGLMMTPSATLLGGSLRHLYKEIVDWLRSHGVEPVAPSQSSVGTYGGVRKAPENSVSRTMLTLDKLRRLLSGELDPSPAAAGVQDFMNTVPASFVAMEDLKLVEPMMKRLAERAKMDRIAASATGKKSAGPTMIAGDRLDSSGSRRSKRLGKELGEEVVRLMLENLMQDQRLLSPVRAQLKALEPVLIKLSQRDARFFTERQHAARLFLDKITSRSLAFTSEEEQGFSRFQKTLENSVNVLVMGEGDVDGFARVLRKLEEGWQREEKEQRLRNEEAARALLHAEQRNLLAQRLTADFSERIASKKIPELVVTFLRGPWAQVVAESQLLCTDGSDDPDGFLSLVDDLIWSVQTKLARRNRSRLVAMVPGMLVKLRQGLDLVSYPHERIAVFFDELIAIHEKAFEGPRSAPVSQNAALTAESDGDGDAVQPDASSEGMWVAQEEAGGSGFEVEQEGLSDKFVPPAEEPELPEIQDWSTDNLTTGSWVDLALGGEWVRAQLTWASPHRTLFMFISGSGMAHSMSLRTLNRLHNMGLIRLVSDGHVMDNALDAVARAALRNDMEKAAGSS